MERKQFTFYRSYLDSIRALPKREQGSILLAICQYALDETVPENLSSIASTVFTLVKPTLDAGRRMAAGGKRGGSSSASEANANGSASLEQAYGKGNASLIEANANGNASEKEGEIEIEVENECSLSSEVPDGTPDAKQKKSFDPEGKPYKSAVWLDRQITKNYPNFRPRSESDLQSWADAFDKTNRIDKRPWEDISDALVFSQEDEFWRQNIRSGSAFRRQYETLYTRMKGNDHGA